MYRFKQMRETLKKDYNRKLEEINHWEKVFKEIQKNKDKGIKEFTIILPHEKGYDNEFKLEGYANEKGYNVVDEELYGNRSEYKLRQKE